MTDKLEQIRSQLSTERTIRSQSSDWHDDSGGDRVGRCTHPVHGHTSSNSDGTPNLIVTEDDGWYCYSHGTGGGIFEWIAVEEGIVSCKDLPLTDSEFKDALKAAADRAGVDLSSGDRSEELMTREAKAQYALDSAVDIMHDRIDEKVVDGRTIRARLRDERGFSDETIDEARIGYIDGQTQIELLETLSKEALKDIGIMRENEKWHCHDRIVYPYFTDGKPSYWIARATEDSEIDAKYLKPKQGVSVFEQPMYEADSIERGRASQLWIVEGIQDSLSLTQAGVDAVSPVATNPSDMQFAQLAERAEQYDDVVICYDADDSGAKKSVDLALELMRHGLSPRLTSVPERDDVDAVVEDPNEHFIHGGELADFEIRSAARAVIEDRGDSEHVVSELLSTVDPDSLRADRLVDEIASATPYRKSVLRKMCKQQYRKEGQAGWIEPTRVEKTDNINPLWTFYWDSGESITLATEELTSGPEKFVEKYVNLFNWVPDFDQDDWRQQVNRWLDEVAVVDPSPHTPEGIARELLCERVEMTPVFSSLNDALTQSGGAIKYDSETEQVVVPKTTIKGWVEDIDCSLRQFREFVSPFVSQNTERVRARGKRVRVWYFDAEEIRSEGYSIETPDGQETPEEEEARLRDMGDEVTDPNGDDTDDDVDRGDGPVTDGGQDVTDRSVYLEMAEEIVERPKYEPLGPSQINTPELVHTIRQAEDVASDQLSNDRVTSDFCQGFYTAMAAIRHDFGIRDSAHAAVTDGGQNVETKTITGWLIVDWRNGKHRTRKSKPNASELGANEIVSKLKVEVEIPEVETTTLSAKARVPKPQVHASDLENLDADELPEWSNVADQKIEQRRVDIEDAESTADYEGLVMELVAQTLLDTPGSVPPDVVEEYVHESVLEIAGGDE